MFSNSLPTVMFVACLACNSTPSAAEAANKAEGRVEFRCAENQPAEGLTEAIVTGTDRKVYLHENTEATNQHIENIRVVRDGRGKPAVEITFTKDGAETRARVTGRHKGKPIAVVVDGRVISAPTVRARLSKKALITGNFTIEEAERIVGAIKESR